jgi:hypothetical protein
MLPCVTLVQRLSFFSKLHSIDLYHMNLIELIDKIDDLGEGQCLFARKPWAAESEAVAEPLAKDFRVSLELSARGLDYFLEVPLIKEVLEVFGDRPASQIEKLNLLVFYAENDAYPDWIYQR